MYAIRSYYSNWFKNYKPTEGISTGTATHNIAHMLMGVSDVPSDRPRSIGATNGFISMNKLDPTRAPDYVIEVAHVDGSLANIAMHGLTCNNSDANAAGWVNIDGGDLTPFVTGTDIDGNTKYGGINRVRVRMLESYPGSNSSYQLNLQARVKPGMLAGDANPAPDGSALYVYASRGRGAWPNGQNAPLNESCTNNSVFTSRTATNGWCNLPYNRTNEVSGNIQIDTASIERVLHGQPIMVHADKVVVVGAKLNLKKSRISPKDVVANGDLVTFKLVATIAGSPVV